MRAARRALRRLEIMRLRFGGGTAPLRQSQDLEFRDDSLQGKAQPIADAHPMRRLHPLGVQVHFAAVDGGGSPACAFCKIGHATAIYPGGGRRRSGHPALTAWGAPKSSARLGAIIAGVALPAENRRICVLKEFRERLERDTQALDAAGLLKRERIIGSAAGSGRETRRRARDDQSLRQQLSGPRQSSRGAAGGARCARRGSATASHRCGSFAAPRACIASWRSA